MYTTYKNSTEDHLHEKMYENAKVTALEWLLDGHRQPVTLPCYAARNENWNGFGCPYFDVVTGLRLVHMHHLSLVYDNSDDVFVLKDEGEGCEFIFKPQWVDTPRGPRKVYPIGARVLTWDTPEFADKPSSTPSCSPRHDG